MTTFATRGLSRIMWVALTLTVATLPGRALADVRAKASGDGRSLTIVGDRAANEVLVMLDAAGETIEVSVSTVPVGRFPAAPVESIRIRLGGGADALGVQLTSGGVLGLRKLSVNLGGGDDFASIDVDPTVVRSVSGGAGDDTVSGPGSGDGYRSVEHVLTWTALVNNGGGPGGLGYSCTSGGSCTCDKSIENDCEDMSGVCTDATVDALITCIQGWLTTHCTCTKALVVRDPGLIFDPIGGGILTR